MLIQTDCNSCMSLERTASNRSSLNKSLRAKLGRHCCGLITQCAVELQRLSGSLGQEYLAEIVCLNPTPHTSKSLGTCSVSSRFFPACCISASSQHFLLLECLLSFYPFVQTRRIAFQKRITKAHKSATTEDGQNRIRSG